MKYEIIGGQLPAVVCKLDRGEKMFTESGGMCWMEEGFSMDSNTRGGLLKGLGRAMSGESIFLTTYTSSHDHAEIAFGSSFPGKILPVTLHDGKTLIVQKNAFLAAEDGVNLQAHFRKKLGTGFFGGEGFVLQKLTGNGTAFLEIDGDIIEIDIPARTINVRLTDEELAARPMTPVTRDRYVPKSLKAYASMVSSADKGAVRLID